MLDKPLLNKLWILLIIQFCYGQNPANNMHQTSNFKDFDTINFWLKTNKIAFLKNNELDTIKSKNYLDSLVLRLNQMPNIVVETYLSKEKDLFNRYRESEKARKQIRSLKKYLVSKKMISKERIATEMIHCGYIRIKNEDIIIVNKKDNSIYTNFRIISIDFVNN